MEERWLTAAVIAWSERERKRVEDSDTNKPRPAGVSVQGRRISVAAANGGRFPERHEYLVDAGVRAGEEAERA